MATGNQSVYERHNVEMRGDGYSILKSERGRIFKATIGTGKRVVDLGCRDGALTRSFLDGNTVTGADIDTVALNKAAKLGIETVQIDLHGDWHELGGRKFDAAVLAETLEHLYYPERIIAKIADLLPDGGVLVGSVPNASNLKNRLKLLLGIKRYTPLQDPTHINHFTHAELLGILRKHFREVRIIPLGHYAALDRLWPGMFSFDMVFVCRK